jgi:hypothetical protein
MQRNKTNHEGMKEHREKKRTTEGTKEHREKNEPQRAQRNTEKKTNHRRHRGTQRKKYKCLVNHLLVSLVDEEAVESCIKKQ